ncbi:Threonine synthase Short=TS [Serendipita indica DSM 11827]|uniref:Probable threonine synthase n=1 Tax=Serendipita indica (strain DSM 11827) TaxID=1109443 RepID=G4TAN0_SERID|nr:Threonine synthase Short=TS [Serendipita indica DSM 11827]CCA68390.1 probable threonine synthase [Serendipita indica DSM 11827]
MKYFSTRGDPEELTFEETVIRGLAPDGGLYIPNEIPSLPSNWEEAWADYSFQELSFAVLSLYIPADEIPSDALKELINKSYSTFRDSQVTPLHQISNKLHILELFHGPTFAFKDVALQFLGNLFEFFLLRRNSEVKRGISAEKERITVLGATSGDTGSAAIYGLRSKANLSIIILHPYGRVSPIQEAQMTTVTDANVHNLAVHGTFDDCQDIVKTCFGDKTFNSKWKLGAINSINWARILAQIVYYFSAYFQAKRAGLLEGGKRIQFVVPTGNFGDVLAGYFAKRMGLPMAKLGIATNANDILARFWNSGKYEKGEHGVLETCSPAMDILISSNFERLLWYLASEQEGGSKNRDGACGTIRHWMSQMKADGKVPMPAEVLKLARQDFVAERVSDEETLETIQRYFKANSYIADPHTAVGLHAADKLPEATDDTIVQIVLSTAHPAKFSEAVTKALQTESSFNFEEQVLPPEFKGLLNLPRRVIEVERPEAEQVKRVIEQVMAADAKNLGTEAL